MERGPSEIPMVSRVLLVKFTNIREGLTEMEIFHDICHWVGGEVAIKTTFRSFKLLVKSSPRCNG